MDLAEAVDIKMLRHESEDMDLAENPEIQRCGDMNRETWILQRNVKYINGLRHGSGDMGLKMLRHESEDVDL